MNVWMATAGEKQRDKLFSIYARNLSFYRPDAEDQFVCPICLKSFDRIALNKKDPEVIRAHVIPDLKMGERVVTLSCKTCDNHVGTTYDAHILNEKKFHDFETGLIEKSIDLSYSSVKFPCYLKPSKEGEPPSFTLKAIDHHEPNFQTFTKDRPPQYHIEIETGFVPMKRDISLLHSAFLMMFYCFGYEYILSENVECVRRIINGSSTFQSGSSFLLQISPDKPLPPVELPAIGILEKPKKINSFVVIVPSVENKKYLRGIALPGFGVKGYETYHRLLNSPKRGINITFNGLTGFSNRCLTMREFVGYCEKLWNYFTSSSQV